MKIYVNPKNFECHTANPDGMLMEIEERFFDGKCSAFIEGHICVLFWYTLESDGVVYHGKMIAPWKDCNELDNAQREHERQLLAEYESALAEIEKALGV
jgi:hypothetical protein